MRQRAPVIVIGLVLARGTAACASIWGFEDGVLGVDGGAPDGTARPDVGGRDGRTAKDSTADVHDSTVGRDSGADVRDATVAKDAGADVHEATVAKDSGADVHDAPVGEDSSADVREASSGRDSASDVHDAATGRDSAADVLADGHEPCAFTCVQGPPANWNGPFVISETAGGPPPPMPAACSGAYGTPAYAGLASPDAPAATCACKCGSPAGGGCAAPSVTLYNGSTCDASSECDQIDASAGVCVTFAAGCTGTYLRLGAPEALPGRCTPTATVDVPDASWMASVHLCGPTEASTATCGGGKVCMPPVPDAAFESTYCVARSGSAPLGCPAGPYSHQRVYYGGATDDRGCSACSCGTPDASCSGGTYTTHKKAGCGANSATFNAPESCASVGADQSGIYNGDAVLTSGACAPDGGAATGSFTPSTPTTICCTQ
jgi:hypothetical protein